MLQQALPLYREPVWAGLLKDMCTLSSPMQDPLHSPGGRGRLADALGRRAAGSMLQLCAGQERGMSQGGAAPTLRA